MALTIGIVGLPNVGKSTLFNALTKNDVLAALRGLASQQASKEKLFGLVFDLFQTSADRGSPDQVDMCEDVLTQLIGLFLINDQRR